MLNLSSKSAIALPDLISSLLIKISIQSDLRYQIPRNVDPLENCVCSHPRLRHFPYLHLVAKKNIALLKKRYTKQSVAVLYQHTDQILPKQFCVRNHCSSSVRSLHHGRGAIKIWSSWPKRL